MENNFDKNRQLLTQSLENKTPSENFEGYLLKGDVSGIQDFIFNVKSQGAAKTLKARSFFISALADIIVERIKQELGNDLTEVIYNGGGNFYIAVKDINKIKAIKEAIEQDLTRQEIYFSIVDISFEHGKDYSWHINKVNEVANKDKLAKFQTSFDVAFSAYDRSGKENWGDFTGNLVRFNDRTIGKSNVEDGIYVTDNKIIAFGYDYCLTENRKGYFDDKVLNKLPKRYNTLVEFSEFGEMSEFRTGTNKLAVFKLDIDNLGTLFQKVKTKEANTEVSRAITWFFENYLWELLCENLDGGKDTYYHNIYTLFAGGDDCFLLGAWDTVFEFALKFQQRFVDFTKGFNLIVERYNSTVKEEDKIPKLTLSASLTMVDSSYPVVRFAHLAEKALGEAKKFEKGEKKKNAISVFGEVISWEDFGKVAEIKNKLVELIKAGESRAILERIKMSSVGFESLQKKAEKGFVRANQIWRLQYFITRNIKTEQGRKIADELMMQYQSYLISAISQKQFTDVSIFPIAARWAEFLTRKDFKTHKTKE